MRNWKHKIKIKHLLDNKTDLSVEELHTKTEAFWQCINMRVYSSFMADFIDEFGEEFEPSSISELEEFNSLLCHLYDYCDYNRIWVE